MGPALRRRDTQTVEVALTGAAAAALAGSWAVVTATDTVPELEADAFAAINGLPDALWPVVWAPVQVGSLVGSLVVVTATAAVTRQPRLTVAALVASQGAVLGRQGREAPRGACTADRPARARRVRERATGLGYVSGHSAVAFVLAVVLVTELPAAWRVVPFAVAGTVGLGRVYAGVHLPLDVVGGVGLGILTGLAGLRTSRLVMAR